MYIYVYMNINLCMSARTCVHMYTHSYPHMCV